MRLTRGWIEVELDAIVRNARTMQVRAPTILPMVKADAYGTGAVRVARALEPLAPWGYGVATIEEGVELREAGIARPIVLFTSVEVDELSAVRDARVTPALASAAAISDWHRIGGGAWHLAIDTGMSRAGIRWDAVRDLSSLLVAHPPQGAFTHFHSASLDDGSLSEQEARFEQSLAMLPAVPSLVHAENSAALARRDRSRWSLGRPGIFLYGVGAGAHAIARPEPVISVRARIVEMRTLLAGETVSYDATFVAKRESRIATLPIGYADGYRRSLGNSAYALIAGRRVPVVGVVTMDMTMLDVTGVEAGIGDVVTLVGGDGAELLDVATIADLAGASPYEILTGFHARLPRHYSGGE
ncbi:MAG TPA: alanine racemase [Gemmatimonadaceae bacterium]|nr:alanine racemase [Gemmatimonadaceae bacterium]